jgi:hypothetical protein
MRSIKLAWACLAISAAIAAPTFAQEGHPLKGSWLGDWGPSKADRNQVFIVMDWDGKQVTGMINPGTDNIRLTNVTVTPPPPRPAGGGRGGGNRGGGGGGGNQGAAAPAAGAAAQGGGNRGGGGGGNQGAAPAAGAAAQGGGNRGGGNLGTQIGGPGTAPPPAPPQDWLVRFEADAKDRAGNAVRYIVEGKIENIGLYNRSISGTWSHGNVKGDFRIQRQ